MYGDAMWPFTEPTALLQAIFSLSGGYKQSTLVFWVMAMDGTEQNLPKLLILVGCIPDVFLTTIFLAAIDRGKWLCPLNLPKTWRVSACLTSGPMRISMSRISLCPTTSTSAASLIPHTAGRYSIKRFRKAQVCVFATRLNDYSDCPLITFTCICSAPMVERLTNSLMMHGRNNGKKLMAARIVQHAFEIVHLLTDQNPIQVLVDAILNTGPREDSTRIGSQGTVRRQAVDVSPSAA